VAAADRICPASAGESPAAGGRIALSPVGPVTPAVSNKVSVNASRCVTLVSVRRFEARPTDDGHAVWDKTLSGYRSARSLSKADAEAQASDMEVLYDAHGQRDPADVRLLDQPRTVDVAEWRRTAGVLDVWIRDNNGQWWGRVRDHAGQIAWYPAGDLRPTTPPTPDTSAAAPSDARRAPPGDAPSVTPPAR
jgi:hypothetical protein